MVTGVIKHLNASMKSYKNDLITYIKSFHIYTKANCIFISTQDIFVLFVFGGIFYKGHNLYALLILIESLFKL
jgi:hypothetical protein